MVFWKRIELYSGYSWNEFSELRDALSRHHISYECRIFSNPAPVSGHTAPSDAHSLSDRYDLYVHQKDLESAMHIMSGRHAS